MCLTDKFEDLDSTLYTKNISLFQFSTSTFAKWKVPFTDLQSLLRSLKRIITSVPSVCVY